jgi:hypothetical protein
MLLFTYILDFQLNSFFILIFSLNKYYVQYEAHTLLKLSVSWYLACPGVRHASMFDTDTHDYIELCHFSNYYRCRRVSVWCLCLCEYVHAS